MGIKATFKSNVPKALGKIDEMQKKRMTRAASFARGKVVEYMTGPKTGREYKVPGTQKTYTASAPGESPAIRTTRLFSSIAQEVRETPRGVEGVVGTPLLYGLFLEIGTYKMRPRPWLAPPLKINEGQIRNILSEEWF